MRGKAWRALTKERARVYIAGSPCGTKQPWSPKKWRAEATCSCGCGTTGFVFAGDGRHVRIVGEKSPRLEIEW